MCNDWSQHPCQYCIAASMITASTSMPRTNEKCALMARGGVLGLPGRCGAGAGAAGVEAGRELFTSGPTAPIPRSSARMSSCSLLSRSRSLRGTPWAIRCFFRPATETCFNTLDFNPHSHSCSPLHSGLLAFVLSACVTPHAFQ